MRVQNKGKSRLLCFHPKDADAFSEALRARWPTIAFEPYDYWDFQKGGFREKEDWRDIPRYRSLGEAGLPSMVRVFVEPEGWTRRWRRKQKPSRSYGTHEITNFPKLTFDYYPSRIRNHNGYTGKKAGRPIDLYPGRIAIMYDKDDKEVQRFLDAVWRITEKLSTNVVDVLSVTTGELEIPARRTMIWFGWHALDWCRRGPQRTLDSNFRPVGTTTRAVKTLISKPRMFTLPDGTRMELDKYIELLNKPRQKRS